MSNNNNKMTKVAVEKININDFNFDSFQIDCEKEILEKIKNFFTICIMCDYNLNITKSTSLEGKVVFRIVLDKNLDRYHSVAFIFENNQFVHVSVYLYRKLLNKPSIRKYKKMFKQDTLNMQDEEMVCVRKNDANYVVDLIEMLSKVV